MRKMKGQFNHEEKNTTHRAICPSGSNEPAKPSQSDGAGNPAHLARLERGRGEGTSGGIQSEPSTCDTSLFVETGEVIVGCKHPNGLVIRYNGQSFLLLGSNDMPKRSALQSFGSLGFTRVPRAFWLGFLQANPDWLAMQNGSVFVSDTQEN